MEVLDCSLKKTVRNRVDKNTAGFSQTGRLNTYKHRLTQLPDEAERERLEILLDICREKYSLSGDTLCFYSQLAMQSASLCAGRGETKSRAGREGSGRNGITEPAFLPVRRRVRATDYPI